MFTDTYCVPALGPSPGGAMGNTVDGSLFPGFHIRQQWPVRAWTSAQSRQVGDQGPGRKRKALSLLGPRPLLWLGIKQACQVRDVGPLMRFNYLSVFVKGKA